MRSEHCIQSLRRGIGDVDGLPRLDDSQRSLTHDKHPTRTLRRAVEVKPVARLDDGQLSDLTSVAKSAPPTRAGLATLGSK